MIATLTGDDAMTIKRQDLDAGRIDLADVTTGKRLALVHPGEILRDDFLQPMKIRVADRKIRRRIGREVIPRAAWLGGGRRSGRSVDFLRMSRKKPVPRRRGWASVFR